MIRRRPLALFAVAVGISAAACGVDPAASKGGVTQEVINGTTYPTLVRLSAGQELAIGFLSDSSGNPFCTGTLIASNVVLTAQHCVRDRDASAIRFGIGDPASPRARIEVYRKSLADWETDIALLQLRADARSIVGDVAPLRFNRGALGSELFGRSAEAVGFQAVSGVSRRRYGVLEVTNVIEKAVVADGNGRTGTCNGDSGGPLLMELGGATVIVGVTMGGNISCVDESYYGRPDVVAGWIDAEIDSYRPPTTSSGGSRPTCSESGFSGTWPVLPAVLFVGPLGWRRRRRRW